MFKSKKTPFVPKPPVHRIKINTLDNKHFLGKSNDSKEVVEERLLGLMNEIAKNSPNVVWVELDGQYIFVDKIVSMTVDSWQYYPPPRL